MFTHDITLTRKLNLLIGAVIASLMALLLSSQYFTAKHDSLSELKVAILDINITVLQLRRNEKDFLLRHDEKYQKKFENNYIKLNQYKAKLDQDMEEVNVAELRNAFTQYSDYFHQLVNTMKEKGLDKNSGSYGQLRTATHALENLLYQQNQTTELVSLLTVRRHEKDYMLRQDSKYINELSEELNILKQAVVGNPQATKFINDYENAFNQYQRLDAKIGLSPQLGLRGKMRDATHKAEDLLLQSTKTINFYIEQQSLWAFWLSIAIFVFVSATLTALIFKLSKSITKPISLAVASISNIIEQRDFTLRVDKNANDEFGEIIDAINKFIAFTQQINVSVDELREVTLAVEQNAVNSQEQLQEQQEKSEFVASASLELEYSVDEIVQNTNTTAETAAHIAKNATVGKTQLDNMHSHLSQNTDMLIASTKHIQELEAKCDNINGFIDEIKSIADQTNLLALNAAIEAARAGEQGRGFSVVADEVRSLAGRTQESTEQITQIITELQTITGSVVNDVNQCKDSSTTSLSEISQSSVMLAGVIEEVESIHTMTSGIATAVEQQSVAIRGINDNITNIKENCTELSAQATTNRETCLLANEKTLLLGHF